MYKQQNYNIIGEPMRGGMGQVTHLYHKHWQKDVAMKQPLEKYFESKEGRKRFYEECARWLRLGIHPHIVQCYYVCDLDEIPTVFMEWMEKGSLGTSMKSGVFYDRTQAQVLHSILEAAIQMAQGLSYSHQKGILHLDVKPDNVLIDQDGCYKISDFGLASLLNQTSGKAYTPCYCAPEQQMGTGICKATDIYCWAVSILHMLVKEAAWFDGIVAGAAFEEIIKKAVVKIPKDFQELLGKCLQYEIENRFQTFEEVLEELIPIYNQCTGSIYVDEYADYDGTSLDALNNMGISYFSIGDLENASKQWQWNYWHNPGHSDSHYNYELFVHRFVGTCELDYLHSEKAKTLFMDRMKIPAFSLLRKSEWQYSLGAYASAYAYACQAKTASEKLFGPSDDIFYTNYRFMKEAYSKKGPRVFKSLDLKKILKIEGSVEEDCILLAFILEDQMIYVGKSGVYYRIDLRVPKIVRYMTGMDRVSCAAVSRDGRYLAVGNSSGGYAKTYEVKVIDLKQNEMLLHKNGKEFLQDLQYLVFVEQNQEIPRLLASDEWKIVSWKIKYDSEFLMECDQKISTHFYELQKHKAIEIPNSNLVICLDKSGGYVVYDYEKQYIVTQESFLLNGGEKIYQLSVNQKGNQMVVLCGSRLEIRNMPDYQNLPEPIWKESSFKTTAEMLKKYHQILEIRKVLERSLDKVIQKEGHWEVISKKALALKLRSIQEYYYQSHKPIDEYLTLTVKMAKAFGFQKVKRMTSRLTNESMDYIRADEEGFFMDEEGNRKLQMQPAEDGMNLNLISAESKKVLCSNICYRNELIGLSKDYCSIICKNNIGKEYQLKVIPLEWLFEF